MTQNVDIGADLWKIIMAEEEEETTKDTPKEPEKPVVPKLQRPAAVIAKPTGKTLFSFDMP